MSETLAKVGGKVTHAAKILGVTHDYLAYTGADASGAPTTPKESASIMIITYPAIC